MVVLLLLLHYNVYCKKIVQHLHLNSAGNIFTWNNSFSARIRSIAVAYSHFGSLVRMEPNQAEQNGNGIQLCANRLVYFSVLL